MASQDNLLNQIISLVAAFDDSSWEALASKGLLRRARKDIEKGLLIEVSDETGDVLQIKVDPFCVSVPPSGFASATCNCPSPGVCQHILAAGLYLQTRVGASSAQKVRSSEASIRDEIIAITADQLKAWAGTSDYRAGVSMFEKNSSSPFIQYEETVIVRLMPSSVEVRFVPGAGLDAMILPKPHGRRAAVAAILALRKSLGIESPGLMAAQSLIEVSGTPRTQKEILTSALSVLEDAVTVGLSHLSSVIAERLVTLAVSAQGANLPRVSLALKSVSDEILSIMQREARADEGRLLSAMARAYALMDAICNAGKNPRLDLAGESRGKYVEVPEIELSGVGAYPWQTGSGYRGLTVLFWTNQTQEFLSWSEARPSTQQYNPRQRFYADGPWDGAQSPLQVAGSTLKLRNARRTVNGRLSGSTKTKALVLTKTDPQSLELGDKLFASWEQLHKYVCQSQPIGLRELNPLQMIGVLKPSVFGSRKYDSITQTFTWDVYDESDDALTMSLAFNDWNKESILALELLRPPENCDWLVVARLALRDNLLVVEPISILLPENPISAVLQLSFEVTETDMNSSDMKGLLRASARSGDESEESFDEDTTSDLDDAPIPGETYLHGVITELNRRLSAIAEAGCITGLTAHRDWLERSRRNLHVSGLTVLAGTIHRLLEESSSAASTILKIRFLTHLHSQAAARVHESS